ncbi:MAG TPA: lactate racemase domain-containing protein [Polyangiaceae bacterium]|jgi:nickel-dependent lactate racemase
MIAASGQDGALLGEAAAREACERAIGDWRVDGKRVLAIVPDGTRTAPMGLLFRVLHAALAGRARGFDVLIANGTHPPMREEAILARFELTVEEWRGRYAGNRFFNHRWDDPRQLVTVGTLDEDEVASLSEGRLRERVVVTLNRLILDYDLLLIVGPTFPHEVAGFSGGNKYLFPGISGKAIIDLFHWLGALVTNPAIIGTKWTPVRAVIDRAAAMVPVERRCISLVVAQGGLAGLYAGTPEEAWSAAADHSERLHVRRERRPFASVLSCAPPMYDELWVGGKCAYKLEPVVRDGGELIIYAPHIARISSVHGDAIRALGYHVRDYFLAQMDRFAGAPRGVMAHATHVKGVGTYAGGVERPRIQVTLATKISEAECRAVNLGYRDPESIDARAWREGGDPERLYVERAGETLYRLEDDPFGRAA